MFNFKVQYKNTYPDGSTPKICVIGAGYSGIAAGIRLKTQLGLTSYTIFDENSDVGGTWLVNTYPGCACDIPSHLYSLSFEPNPNWSTNYPYRDEIWNYLKTIATKHNLYSHIRFNTKVKCLEWIEHLHQWKVTFVQNASKELEEYEYFDLIINGPGALRVPRISEEFQKFKKAGPLIHSGAWDDSIDLTGKVVGIIGSGATAIQLIPQLVENENGSPSTIKELHCYQRHPAYVLPLRQFQFPSMVKKLFNWFPIFLMLYRWILFWIGEFGYITFVHKSIMSYFASWMAIKYLKSQVGNKNPLLLKKLIPNYTIGCKRITISSKYFKAMTRPNVFLHRSPILRVLETGSIETAEDSTKLDILVLATGFRIQEYFAPMKIIGKDCIDVLESWMNYRPTGHLGIVSSMMPNQFGLLGPNTGLGHNTVIFNIECQVNYIIQLISEMMSRNARTIEVKPEIEDEFKNFIDKGMKNMVWGNAKCGSWYAINGIVTTLWPESCLSYWKKLYKPDFTQYNFIQRLA